MRISLRTGLTVAALALVAGCVPAGQPMGAAGGGGAGAGGPGAAGPAPAAGMRVPQIQMPQLRWPVFGPPAAGAAAGQAQIRDPFAGQGVRQAAVEPARTATAGQAAPAATTAPAAPATAARTHTVAAGETAWSISRRYGVSVQDLAAANGLPENMTVRLGQTLRIPAAAGAGGARVAVTAPGVGSPTPMPPSAAAPLPNERTEPASRPAPRTGVPDLGATRTAASGSGRLSMPVNGAIIRAYSKGRNEGIDIAAPAGTPVKAAGSGTVAAITRDTDGVPIVVVRHDGDLLTVYAGLDDLSVEKGQAVSAGQSIGKARSSGSVHFEVRQGFDSVDPEKYL
ncbi:M23 family metallopeptidase [Paracoccus sp. Z118]|uniref:M23 family metallopeptidase n=1 Tax=Paracoccus sp. Z118 TaxID=2851017 RepID=UPI0020B6DB31|nr:M23 family metallopeptidase [Paracoccus sp. Z118]